MPKINIRDDYIDDGCIPKQEWFVRKILSNAHGLTLDCGCGRGLWSRKLRNNGIDVVSTDLSVERLRKCKRERNSDMIVLSSSTHLPFRSGSFDSSLFLEVIEHVSRKKQEESLSEINRILRNNGVLVVTTPNKPIYRILTMLFFEHNPEHIYLLSLNEAKRLFKKHFQVVLVDGKIGFFDRLVPSFLCWDLLFVLRKQN